MKGSSLIAVIALIFGVVVGGFGMQQMGAIFKIPGFPQPGPTPTTVIRSGPTIINAIQTQAKLETVAMYTAKDMTLSRTLGVGGVCTEEITYLGYFNVTAGIDLTKVTKDQIIATNDGQPDLAKVTIMLPSAQIMHIELDTKNSRIVAQRTPVWVPGCSDDSASMTVEAQDKIRQEIEGYAKETGIIKQAEDKAAMEIQRILLQAGYHEVTVKFSGN